MRDRALSRGRVNLHFDLVSMGTSLDLAKMDVKSTLSILVLLVYFCIILKTMFLILLCSFTKELNNLEYAGALFRVWFEAQVDRLRDLALRKASLPPTWVNVRSVAVLDQLFGSFHIQRLVVREQARESGIKVVAEAVDVYLLIQVVVVVLFRGSPLLREDISEIGHSQHFNSMSNVHLRFQGCFGSHSTFGVLRPKA